LPSEEVSLLKPYETLVVLNADLGEEKTHTTIESFLDVINSRGGKVEHVDYWGPRKLAYLVGKQAHGYYVLLYYHADDKLLDELRRRMKYSEHVIRQMTTAVEAGKLAGILASLRERSKSSRAAEAFGSEAAALFTQSRDSRDDDEEDEDLPNMAPAEDEDDDVSGDEAGI
jgi:small subunit ribosomal protein S6